MVTAWRYEGSAVPVPWRALGEVLFEMGACSCSVSVEKEPQEGEQQEGKSGEQPMREAAAAAAVEGEEAREAKLTFIVAEGGGGRSVGSALEAACELAGGPDGCFGETRDWRQ